MSGSLILLQFIRVPYHIMLRFFFTKFCSGAILTTQREKLLNLKSQEITVLLWENIKVVQLDPVLSLHYCL